MSKKKYNNKNNTKSNKQKRVKYKVRNWSEYNSSLKKHGSITFWFNEEIVKQWYFQGSHKQGAPTKYSSLAIETILTLRSIFRLPLRNVEGFLASLVKVMNLQIDVPDYTTLCRRQRSLTIKLRNYHNYTEPIHLVLDSTGLKVFGEGEWKVRRHGYTKHRMWRKLHIGINRESGEVIAKEVTTNSIKDSTKGAELIETLNQSLVDVTGDAGYDTRKMYETCKNKHITPIIRTQKNARIRAPGNSDSVYTARDNIVMSIRDQGIDTWKKESGYSKRALVETTMFRYKTAFTDKPQARLLENQKVEVALKCNILNDFLFLAKPISYSVLI